MARHRATLLAVLIAGVALSGGSATGWGQTDRNETAEQNVRASRQYEQLLCSNPGFRAKRIAQECGPITDRALHKSCVASFDCNVTPRESQFRRAPPSQTVR